MRLIDLTPLHEIDFSSQGAFDRYNKQHKLRPDTKVVVAGRVTTAGRASQNSPSPVKGTSVFGSDKEKAVNKEKYPVGTKFFKPNGNQNIEVVRVEGDKIFVVSDIMPGKEWQWREDSIDDDIKNQKLQVKSTNNKISGDDKNEPKRVSLSDELDNIKDLTDKNDHNGAVMALAKMTGDKSYIEQMQKIQRYHELKGHMPQSLIKYRTAIMKNLLAQVQKKYGNKFAKQVNNAF